MTDHSDFFDYIERFDPEADFMDAYWLSRQALGYLIAGDSDRALEQLELIYPKLRFMFECYSRYVFASQFIGKNDFVLDVPCGTGYGTAYLARYAAQVTGIDIDRRTVQQAQDKYDYPNVSFLTGDMMECELPAADVIVCFEGLEHITPGEVLIQRFVEALPDTGKLIVSVPINEDKIRSDKENPFHEEKYDLDKLSGLLERYFGSVVYFGTDIYGSVSDVGEAFNGIVAICEV